MFTNFGNNFGKPILASAILFGGLSITTKASINTDITTYEKSGPVVETVRTLRKNVLNSSKGLCAKYVRLGFMASGLIPTHPGISYAKNYTPYFNKERWTNLFSSKTSNDWSRKIHKDLFNAPSGCAVVYDAIDARNDRNGHIGHIETRVKNTSNTSRWGFISDYFEGNSRAGLKCVKKGKTVKRLKVFTARGSSPYYKGGKRIKTYINVTTCAKYSSAASTVSDEWKNRKVIGVHCKLRSI